jgi:DNA-binding transcriptional ArsR family regulator
MSIPDELVEEVSRRFALLSDPTRLRILSALLERDEATVSELAAQVGGAAPNVSQHLSRLLSGAVVGRRRDGREVRYSISDLSIRPLCDLVCSALSEPRSSLLRLRPPGLLETPSAVVDGDHSDGSGPVP